MLLSDASLKPAVAAETEEPSATTVLVLALAFFAALSIYFAVVEGPGRLHHDMSEAFAWGREYQLGYHQHPPFWAWICGAWFTVFPHEIWAFGILSALNATLGLYGAWLLIGDFASGRKRLTATALLLLMPSYTYLAFKYNANIILISLWPLTLHAFMRAIDSGLARGAAAFGLLAGLALMSKYYSVILIVTCAIAALAQAARRSQPIAARSRRHTPLAAAAASRPTTRAGAKKLAMCQKAATKFTAAAIRAAIL